MTEQKFPEPTCGALIFNKEDKMFLMKSRKWKNKYVIPGWHVELGEKIEDALKIEIKEETGLKIFNIVFICFQEFIYDNSFWKKKHFIFFDFVCKANSTKVQLNLEGQDFIWVTIQEALSMPIEAYTMNTIKEFLKKFPNGP